MENKKGEPMKSPRTTVLICVALCAAMFSALPASAARDAAVALPAKLDRDILAPNASPRAIVGFRHDVTEGTIRRLAAAGITQAVVLDTIDAVGVLGPRSAYLAIARWADVAYVDADSPIHFDNYVTKKDTHVLEARAGKRPLRKGYTGKGVTVAVVDTGVFSPHPDLSDRVVNHVNFEPSWFFDMIYDGVYSDRLSELTGNAIDSYGHGTHVAGIVAGTGAAGQSLDFSGVAPGASIANFKIADAWQGVTCSIPCDFGWEINALVAFEYMIEHRSDPVYPGGIRVSTNSWSIYEVDSEVEPITLITKEAVKKGITVLFAAGNDGPGANTVALGPNRLPEVITVAAACKSIDSCGAGKVADFSSRGPQVDVAAPGDNVWSVRAGIYGFIGGIPAPPGADNPPAAINNTPFYINLSGTSMATPHVAGVVALMLEANSRLTPAKVQSILKSTAMDRGTRGFDTSWGAGMVNAFEAVRAALKA
jgi:serine protease AprX